MKVTSFSPSVSPRPRACLRQRSRVSPPVQYPLRLLLLAFTASLVISTSSRLFADVVTIEPSAEGKDAFVAQMTAGTNYGSSTALASGQGPDFGGSEKRALLQFDLSSIPAGATINSATLSLYVSQAAGGAQTASAYKVSSTWDESSVNWNSQPSSDAAAVSSVAVNSTGWKSWTITSLVASWCNGTVTNNGVLVKQSSGSPPNNVQFYSSDYGGDATLRPKLVVDYSAVNNPPTAVSLNAPTNITDTTISLSWSLNADADFQSYKLYRSTTPGVTEQSTLVTTVTQQTSTAFTDTGLAATTAYYYRVFVVDTLALSTGSNEASATTASPPPPPPSVANLSVSATPTSIVADGAAQSTITATLTDVNNQPVADHVVDFTTTAGTLSAASATSNAQGNASVTLTSGTTASTANIVSTSSGLTGTCSVTFTAAGGGQTTTVTVGADPATLPPDGIATSSVSATVTVNGQPAANGTEVVFQTTWGTIGADATATTTSYTTTTTSGVAHALLKSANTPPANNAFTLSAVSGGVTGNLQMQVEQAPPPPNGATISVAVAPTLITADGVTTGTVTSNVTADGQQPAPDGTTVTLTTTWGSFQGADPATPGTLDATTVNGVATVVLVSSNTMPTGTSTFTVMASALGAQGTATSQAAQQGPATNKRIVLNWLQPTCNINPPCVYDGGTRSGGGALHFYIKGPPPPIPNHPSPLMGFTSFRAYEVADHLNQEKIWPYLPNDLLLNQITCTAYTDPAQVPPCAPPIVQGDTLLDFYTGIAPGWGTDDFHNGEWVVEAHYWEQATPTSPVDNKVESIHIWLNNLLVQVTEDGDHPHLLKWVSPGSPLNKTKVQFKLTCEGEVEISPQVRIYDLSRTDPAGNDAIRTVTLGTQLVTAGGATWELEWDGQRNAAMPNQMIPAQPGVYAFEVLADWMGPTCGGHHSKTSEWLFLDHPKDAQGNPILQIVEYTGRDVNGTPDDPTDDSYVFHVKDRLRDTLGTAAFEAKIELYDPDLVEIKEWLIPDLTCLEHNVPDGLIASAEGVEHAFEVKVPVGLMPPGQYHFAVSALDDHNLREKRHLRKRALEIGDNFCMPMTEMEFLKPLNAEVVGGDKAEVRLKVTTICSDLSSFKLEAKELTAVHETDWVTVDERNPWTVQPQEILSDTWEGIKRIVVYKLKWNTLSTHNCAHELKASAIFNTSIGPTPVATSTFPNVANLVVASVSASNTTNADYFKYDPDSEDLDLKEPSIKFTISDDGDPHQYRWVVYMRPTPASDWSAQGDAYVQGDASGPGEVTATWNGKKNNNTSVDDVKEPRNTYTFDIYVWETDDAATFNYEPEKTLDQNQFKTPYVLKIPVSYTIGDPPVTKPGHDLKFEVLADDNLHAIGSYYLDDVWNKDASSAHVDFLDPDFNVKGTAVGGTANHTSYENIDLYTFSENEPEPVTDDPNWRGIFMATDHHPEANRLHEDKRMLAVNGLKPGKQASNYDVNLGILSFHTTASAQMSMMTQLPDFPLAKKYTNANASLAATRLLKDAVFWYAGHGAHDHFNFDPDITKYGYGILTYPGTNWQSDVDVYYIPHGATAQDDATAMSHVFFFGSTACEGAKTSPNVLTEAKKRGCRSVLGFEDKPDGWWCERYSELFWHYCLQNYYDDPANPTTVIHGRSTSAAAQAAAVQLARENSGEFHGFRSPRTFNTSQYLVTHSLSGWDNMPIEPAWPPAPWDLQ